MLFQKSQIIWYMFLLELVHSGFSFFGGHVVLWETCDSHKKIGVFIAFCLFLFWFITGSRQGWKGENFSSVKRRDQKGRYTKTSIILSESFMHIYYPILQGPLFMLEKLPHENNWSKSTNFWFFTLSLGVKKYRNPGHGINAKELIGWGIKKHFSFLQVRSQKVEKLLEWIGF